MRGVKYNGDEKLSLLELVLRLEGEFRRSLEPIRVTPIQAGALLYLSRHADAGVTDTAASLGVGLSTLSVVVKALERKRGVVKRYSATDRRAVCVSLSRRGKTLALQIERRIHYMQATLVEQDRSAMGMNLKGSRP